MAENWQYLYVTPNTLQAVAGQDDEGQRRVLLLTDYDSRAMPWLAPDLRFALTMRPEEARRIGKALLEMADEAEA